MSLIFSRILHQILISFTMKRLFIFTIALLAICATASARNGKNNNKWQECIIAAIDSFPGHGGYYTGGKPNADFSKTTMQALNEAFYMTESDKRPSFNPMLAQPSFCSSATYAVLIKALLLWDDKNSISKEAWINMKPYVGIVDSINTSGIGQDDGFGFWGRANANGPGIGVLVHELNAGYNITAFRGAKSEKNKETASEHYMTDKEWCNLKEWDELQPGDFLKIFWDRNDSGSDCGAIIGCNDVKGDNQERGHSVVFLGFEQNGDVRYWSSNGPGKNNKELGYSMASCPRTRIQRFVATRITNPENFDNARTLSPTNENKFLSGLNGHKHATTEEMLQAIGAK